MTGLSAADETSMRGDEIPAQPGDVAELTLLFTDIEGSSKLARAHGVGWAAILEEHRRVLREAFGGGVERDAPGDGFFFTFASTRAAVEAVVAAQRALARHPWPGGARVRVRMGLHTASFERGAPPVGLEVHRASRICEAGHGGQVLLSAPLRSVVAAALPAGAELRDLGPHRLKGLEGSDRIWQLSVDGAEEFPALRLEYCRRESDRPTWLDAPDAGAFVGRAAELTALRAGWERAGGGHRVLGLLAGEAGIGKTSLARALAQEVHGAGGLVLQGRFDEEVVAPYQAFRQALTEYARDCPATVLTAQLAGRAGEISRLFPEVAARVGEAGPPLAAPPEAERLRLFEAMDGWLTAIAATTPVLLVLDDLHWADRPSLLLLRHLLLASSPARLMVVAGYRDTEDGELATFDPGLHKDIDWRRLDLGGLTPDETEQLLGRHGAGGPSAAALAAALHDETRGNPFFLRELIRHVHEVGAAGRRDLAELAIPPTVRDAVRAHLARLSPECPNLLAVAAAIGAEFDLDVLAETSQVGDGRVLELVEEAARSGLVQEVDGDARFSFSHAVVRRALQEGLSRTRRARLHLRIADALERRPGVDPAELAHHYVASAGSGATAKAIHFARLAGRQALTEVAYESAVLHFERALAALDRHGADNPTTRTELLLELGEAHDGAGDYAERDKCMVAAAAVARDIDRSDLFARAALGYGGLLPAAVDPDLRARTLLGEALRRLGDGDGADRAKVLARLAHWEHYALPHPRRRALADEAVEMARRLDNPSALATVLYHRGWALDGPADGPDQADVGAEVAALGRAAGNLDLVLQGQRLRLDALFAAGDFTAAKEAGTSLARLAARLRHPEHLRFATMWEVAVAAVEGRYEEADRLAGELFGRLRQVAHPHAGMIWAAQRFSWMFAQGRAGEFVPLFTPAAEARPNVLGGRALLAWCHAAAGDVEHVRWTLRDIDLADVVAADQNYLWWGLVTGFTHATVATGDRRWAEALYRMALPHERDNATLGLAAFLGSASYHLGLLAAVAERWDAAADHLAAALERHTAMRAPAWVTLTEAAYGDVLAARGAPGDAERADLMHAQARRGAAELGLTALVRAGRPLAAG